jgi:uncharacterized membrane protein YedE/YeeE
LVSQFTPGPALLGGALIGLAAVGCALLLGRIAGISGIAAGVLRHRPGETLWRAALLGGLIAAPAAYALFLPLPPLRVTSSWPLLAAAGFLVGIGTQYGSGCTSGHGVCGISRLSARSIVATLAFMASGFLTVYVVRHVLA